MNALKEAAIHHCPPPSFTKAVNNPLMLRSLLSPLSDRFAISPRPEISSAAHTEDIFSPEDFARDVLVEVMRNAVERLKFAEGLSTRSEVHLLC
jgi:hypothetical protein